ncbi:hypothetical protein CW745_05260 [Psychromonas sp. psych-6C06]|uniref:glycoside hydrolase family 9 protein n=1 Tax=Psychromonas sp. psych-6C06 TaxID=2058089 RepID=UPI000C32874A|nr:glycoside hydrolase family 9 protein [Psychromonas sp. psych-6C06]PKF62830.1 hypothetical protein CW745_05260 [Psychromonas sp. psych-6C06]
MFKRSLLVTAIMLACATQQGCVSADDTTTSPRMLSNDLKNDAFLRYNQVGYLPKADKKMLVIADHDLKGNLWVVTRNSKNITEGIIGDSISGRSEFAAKPFNHTIDLSELQTEGEYKLSIYNKEHLITQESFSIKADLYPPLANEMLKHLSVARSGEQRIAPFPASHLGDKKAPIYQPQGDWSEGQWQADKQQTVIDVSGGWYDAGDYIKFTITNALTTYLLLKSYQVNPDFFQQDNGKALLTEAQFGLDYLMKLYQPPYFIIQVSSGDDHNEGYRLPENDSRDGKREAFSAYSMPHMGLTAAALALGSSVFKSIDEEELASQYLQQAIAIYDAIDINQPQAGAFENNSVNEFYRDKTGYDNLALASSALFQATDAPRYRDDINKIASKVEIGYWVSWADLQLVANNALASIHSESARKAQQELQYFRDFSSEKANIWGTLTAPTWAPIPNALLNSATAAEHDIASQENKNKTMIQTSLDYLLGKNNWGVLFIALEDQPNSAKNIYGQIYNLSHTFPQGAIAEGPGDKTTHDEMLQWMSVDLDTPLSTFNTETEVFYDDSHDFQTMETVVWGQAAGIYLLSAYDKLMKQ